MRMESWGDPANTCYWFLVSIPLKIQEMLLKYFKQQVHVCWRSWSWGNSHVVIYALCKLWLYIGQIWGQQEKAQDASRWEKPGPDDQWQLVFQWWYESGQKWKNLRNIRKSNTQDMVMDLLWAIVGNNTGCDCQLTFWPHQLMSNAMCKTTERPMVENWVQRKDQNLFIFNVEVPLWNPQSI